MSGSTPADTPYAANRPAKTDVNAAQGDNMKAALLPDELVKPNSRTLAELGQGETGYILFTELIVKSDRSCFLNLEAELRNKGMNRVQVRIADDGSFHVVVPSDTTYRPGKPSPRSDAKLQPVASITIGPPEIR
jgi:hypothetical protein